MTIMIINDVNEDTSDDDNDKTNSIRAKFKRIKKNKNIFMVKKVLKQIANTGNYFINCLAALTQC